MAFKKSDGPLTYKVGDVDEVVDSRGNTVIMLRKVAWGSGKEKLEIRKWFVDINKETAGRGVTFLTDEGPTNLINTMIKCGYGDTQQIIEAIKDREDFDDALMSIGRKKPTGEASSKYYDAKEACVLE